MSAAVVVLRDAFSLTVLEKLNQAGSCPVIGIQVWLLCWPHHRPVAFFRRSAAGRANTGVRANLLSLTSRALETKLQICSLL